MQMEYRETGLPMNQPEVFKAFAAWRTNAKDYAKLSQMDEKYPLEVAQLINAVNPQYTSVMKLALLTAVPEPAWSVIEKRFGADTVATLEETAKHARTGFSYCEGASDEIKGVIMATAIKAFGEFIDTDVDDVFSTARMGASAQEIVHKLKMPECKMFDRLADKLTGTAYPDLEKAYAEKLAEYREARKERSAQLAQKGMPFDDEDEEEALKIPFEMHGLDDAPEMRKAYEILTHDSRVGLTGLANGLSVGRLLSELPGAKDYATIAAGMIDAGLSRRSPDDAEFLAKKLPAGVMNVLNNYDIKNAVLTSAEDIVEAPPAVRQLAVAKGLVMLSMAQKQCENIMEFIDTREGKVPAEAMLAMKVRGFEPLKHFAAVIPAALSPILNKTGSRQLEQLFDAQVKDLNRYVDAHAPATASPGINGGRISFRIKPSPGGKFGL